MRATMIDLDPAPEEPAPPLDRFARLLGLSVTELPDGRRIVTLPSKPLTAFERATLPAFGALQAVLQDVDSDMALHEWHRRALVRTTQDGLDVSEDMDALAGVIAAREAFRSGKHAEAAQRYAEVLEARSLDWQSIQPEVYNAAGRTEDAARALRRAAPGDRT